MTESREQEMGKLEHIYLAKAKRQAVERVDTATLEAGKGLVGDRYHKLAETHLARGIAGAGEPCQPGRAGSAGQIFVSHGLTYDYGEFRRSIITSGIDLNALVGQHFRLGEAELFGVELCAPCAYLASIIHPAALPDLALSAGLRATVIGSGQIRPGDSIRAISPVARS